MEHQSIQKTCGRCHAPFSCKVNDIAYCNCQSVKLTQNELALIKQNYLDCLCYNCLINFNVTFNKLNKFLLLFLFTYVFTFSVKSQFHGPVGASNCNAIHKDSSAIVSWASHCFIKRGYQSMLDVSLGNASVGADTSAKGKAGENGVVSLGDRGEAVLTFSAPIVDGPGNDLVVFENSFNDSFLELAFVEVSSDGVHFVRFPATSLTQTLTQIGAYDDMGQAEKLNNLAGKYRALYGTPFDLNELKDSVNINIQAITHVKIIDVVGSINSLYAQLDQYQTPINDPFPTAFPNGGFDLDAVGVIHQAEVITDIESSDKVNFLMYPNPCQDFVLIESVIVENTLYEILDVYGKLIMSGTIHNQKNRIDTRDLTSGIYSIKLTSNKGFRNLKLMKE